MAGPPVRGLGSWQIPSPKPLTEEEGNSLDGLIEYLRGKKEQKCRPSLDDAAMQSYLDLATRDLKRKLTITLDSSSSDDETQVLLASAVRRESIVASSSSISSDGEEPVESSSSDEETEPEPLPDPQKRSRTDTDTKSTPDQIVHPSTGHESSLTYGARGDIKLEEVPLDEEYIKVSLAGDQPFDAILNTRTGFLNATRLCVHGRRKLGRFTCLKRIKKVEMMLLRKHEMRVASYEVKIGASGARDVAGTYFHPALFLELAAWLSPRSYVCSALVINRFFDKTEYRRSLWYSLFASKESTDVSIVHVDQHIRRMVFADFTVIVDERSWFDAEHLCNVEGKNLTQFKSAEVFNLKKYLRQRSLFDEQFYHPLLFLRLAAWLGVDLYLKCARLIICCEDAALNSLLRMAIASAVSELVGGPQSPPTTGEPSTSSSQATLDEYRFQVKKVLGSAMSDEDQDSDIEVLEVKGQATTERKSVPVDVPSQSAAAEWDSEDEEIDLESIDDDRQISYKKHVVELARVRRECKRRVKRANLEKEEALAQVQEMKASLERVEKEKLVLEEQMLQAEKEREVPRSLKPAEPRVLRKRKHSMTAADIVGDHRNIAKLDCMVLVVSSETVLYVYVRKFDKMIPTLYRNIDKIFRFLGWFIAKGARIDYKRVENVVRSKALDCGQHLRLDKERRELAVKGGSEFDLPLAVCSMLRVDIEVIEADVRVLSRLFDKPMYDNSIHPAEDPQWSDLLARAQRWVEQKHAKYVQKKGAQRPRLGGQTTPQIEATTSQTN